MQNKRAEEMWREYLKSIGEAQNEKGWKYAVWHFCDDEKNADELAELCRKGVKRGTASLCFWYEEKGERQPQIGDYSIITDWHGTPRCLIRTKKITIVPFREVSEEMAGIEGEGDGTLSYWQDAHKKYFTMELFKEGRVFNDEMKVLFEEIELLYPASV